MGLSRRTNNHSTLVITLSSDAKILASGIEGLPFEHEDDNAEENEEGHHGDIDPHA